MAGQQEDNGYAGERLHGQATYPVARGCVTGAFEILFELDNCVVVTSFGNKGD
ncbi:hypothetical protein RvY_02472 [Ramazzottius varieornatus]|uniref:Uncharacterized protein n=1 Tax=Ramazzottius varieornatus TaxID=947166 RepID=A0A1D1UUY8_RAMVA|nr:hypothetical protein RvY_02472 [Ramazzottius varieornatus]